MQLGKKIVILNGSPRPHGNTVGLIEAFQQGAEQAGHSVTRLDLTRLGIHPCLGCDRGGMDPSSPCVQKDGMEKVYPAYVEADIVVLASPLYSWSVSAQIKCVLDRLYALGEGETPVGSGAEKEAVLLMAGASAPEKSGPQMAMEYFKVVCQGIGWKWKGVIYAKARNLGDIKGSAQLEEAFQLGASLK